MHKRADGVYKAPFNINMAARAWAVRVRQRPGPRAIKTPRRACAQAGEPAPLPNQEGIVEGGVEKHPGGFNPMYILYPIHMQSPPQMGPTKQAAPF